MPILNKFWDRSSYRSPNAREVSGKISFFESEGKYAGILNAPGSSNVTAPHATWSSGVPRGPYARPNSRFYDIFDVHTHPFDTGQSILITGEHVLRGTIQKAGNVLLPSKEDWKYIDPRFIGLIVTKTAVVVYTQGVGRRCTVAR